MTTHLSILIVDDSAEDRYLLKRYLKKSGLNAAIAETTNGEQGLEFLMKEDQRVLEHPEIKAPLIVFLDVNMPIMNGWEFLEEFRVRQDKIRIRPTVVVMYSTSDRADDMARIDEYDFVKSYVVKGRYSPAELKNTINECVNSL